MNNLKIKTVAPDPILQLKQASWISRNKNVQFRIPYIFHLSVQYLHRQLGLGQVVDTGAATTLICARDLNQFHTRNTGQQLSRSAAHALSVNQMTGVIVSYAQFQTMGQPGLNPCRRQKRA
jgi:hypothetical protein